MAEKIAPFARIKLSISTSVDFHIFDRACFLLECQHIASHSILIMADPLALPDELSFGADHAAAEQFRDHINDTGTAKSYRLWFLDLR